MYDNENYSGNDGSNQTSGLFSGAQGTVNPSQSNTGNNTAYNYNNYQTERNGAFSGYREAQYNGQYADKQNTVNYTDDKSQPKSGKKRGAFLKKALLSVCLGLFFGLFAGVGFYAVQQGLVRQTDGQNSVAENTPSQKTADDSEIKLTNTNNITVVQSDVSDVVEEVMPAMVSIVNNYVETGSFFGQTYTQEQAASGSGIIVAENDTELLVVTNYHVIADANSLEVTFIDGSTGEAKVKGTDSEMDLAVISVPLESLSEETKNAISVATLGNSDELKMGEPVIAIGNALGYGQSVTDGIVSALNREMTLSDGSTGTFIQTNAEINPGNSGGALLNINGEVIGINSNKIGGDIVEGMGYAIPISAASPIIADLMERQTREKVEDGDMGYMGISPQVVSSQYSQMFGMPTGIYVLSVEKGSAAEKAGILTGDIITRFDGERVTSDTDLKGVMQYFAAGDTAEITVMRPERGEYVEHKLEITLGERPKEK